MVKDVARHRPDFKLIISSATLDARKFHRCSRLYHEIVSRQSFNTKTTCSPIANTFSQLTAATLKVFDLFRQRANLQRPRSPLPGPALVDADALQVESRLSMALHTGRPAFEQRESCFRRSRSIIRRGRRPTTSRLRYRCMQTKRTD